MNAPAIGVGKFYVSIHFTPAASTPDPADQSHSHLKKRGFFVQYQKRKTNILFYKPGEAKKD